jgi:hut operon positive regulator
LNSDMTIGKLAVLLAVSSNNEENKIFKKGEELGYKLFKGRVGQMTPRRSKQLSKPLLKLEGLPK